MNNNSCTNNNFKKILEFTNYVQKNKPSFDELLVILANLAKDMVLADRATIWIYDEAKNTLWTKVGLGLKNVVSIPADTGVVGHVVSTKEFYLIPDAYKDPYFNPNVDKSTGYLTKNILAVPIFDENGDVFGVFQVINKMPNPENIDESDNLYFADEDVELLNLVAQFSANTLINHTLEQEILDTQIEMIYTLAQTIESRSEDTGLHIKRVSLMSVIMAQLCNLPPKEVELLRIASTLHDVGKIAVPDAILFKPGKLTNEEFDIIKTHTTAGYNILKHSKREILKAAALIANEHHEKYNGRGYPQGKKGDEIHIFAKIVSIVDVFDALLSKRCYKSPFSLEEVREIITKDSGEGFDPKLVEIFMDNFDKFVEIQKSYIDND